MAALCLHCSLNVNAYSFLIDANDDEFACFPPTNVRNDVEPRDHRSGHRLKPPTGGHGPTSAPGIPRRGIPADAVSSSPRLLSTLG